MSGRHAGEEWKIVKPAVITVSLPRGEAAGEEWKIVKPAVSIVSLLESCLFTFFQRASPSASGGYAVSVPN